MNASARRSPPNTALNMPPNLLSAALRAASIPMASHDVSVTNTESSSDSSLVTRAARLAGEL